MILGSITVCKVGSGQGLCCLAHQWKSWLRKAMTDPAGTMLHMCVNMVMSANRMVTCEDHMGERVREHTHALMMSANKIV